jgi:hypothetical protein
MTLLRSRTLSVSINCKPKTIYEFVLNLENFPIWAKMACRSIKLFTLYQLEGMSEEKYAEDLRMVEQDLQNLKSIVENIPTQ